MPYNSGRGSETTHTSRLLLSLMERQHIITDGWQLMTTTLDHMEGLIHGRVAALHSQMTFLNGILRLIAQFRAYMNIPLREAGLVHNGPHNAEDDDDDDDDDETTNKTKRRGSKRKREDTKN